MFCQKQEIDILSRVNSAVNLSLTFLNGLKGGKLDGFQ